MILFSFALVFIVVYLYYTINDVKKLGIEVKKNAQDLQALAKSLAKQVSEKQVCEKPAKTNETVVIQDSGKSVKIVTEDDDDDDIEEEITPEEMKKLLNEIPTDDDDDEDDVPEAIADAVDEEHAVEEEVEEEAEEEIKEAVEPEEVVEDTLEQLKKLKLEELKTLCKNNNVPIKGTKEQLIARLVAL